MYLFLEVEGSRVLFSFELALSSTTDLFSYEWSFYQQTRFFKNCIPSQYKMCKKSSYPKSFRENNRKNFVLKMASCVIVIPLPFSVFHEKFSYGKYYDISK